MFSVDILGAARSPVSCPFCSTHTSRRVTIPRPRSPRSRGFFLPRIGATIREARCNLLKHRATIHESRPGGSGFREPSLRSRRDTERFCLIKRSERSASRGSHCLSLPRPKQALRNKCCAGWFAATRSPADSFLFSLEKCRKRYYTAKRVSSSVN